MSKILIAMVGIVALTMFGCATTGQEEKGGTGTKILDPEAIEAQGLVDKARPK